MRRPKKVMKLKLKYWIGLAIVSYCIVAYIFMWPPVVTNYWHWHRQTASNRACINSLRVIDATLNQWGLEHGKHTGDPVAFEDLKPYFPSGYIPSCPFGGKYSITILGAKPTCSIVTNPPGVMRIRRGYFFYEETYSQHHSVP